MNDRTLASSVVVGDLAQHQSFARREPDAEAPFLPIDLPAIDAETRPLRLDDIERFEIGALRRQRIAIIVPLLLRHRDNHVVIDEIDDFFGNEIDDRDKAFDRVRITVVLGVLAPVTDGTDDAAASLEFAVEKSRREWIDLDEVEL